MLAQLSAGSQQVSAEPTAAEQAAREEMCRGGEVDVRSFLSALTFQSK